MRKRYAAFTVMLGVVMLMKLGLPVMAEMAVDAAVKESYSAEVSYMLGSTDDVKCVLTKEKPAVEGEAPQTEIIYPQNTHVYENGQARAEILLTLKKADATEENWNEVNQWIDFAIASAGINARGQGEGQTVSASALARDLLTCVLSAQQKLTFENGQASPFDKSVLSVDSIKVWSPYYAELKRGDRSDDVVKLQERLITLGYLTGTADGQFGKITAQAVQAAQKELLEKEKAVYALKAEAIDKPEKTATPAPEADETQSPETTPEASETDEATTPEATPEATPAPYVPETKVDGVASQIFQIRLYSSDFPITVPDLSTGSAGLIERFQKRLIELGYMTGGADGDYGANTRRGVRLLQHYNGLKETGVADENAQKLAYSNAVKAAANPILTNGSSGDGVKKLQNFLIKYGFMRGAADGDYGAATTKAVTELQTYLRDKEIAEAMKFYSPVAADPAHELRNDSEAKASPSPTPTPDIVSTIDITGVADPLLLDEIYSAPVSDWIPSALKNGDAGSDVKRVQTRLQALEYIYYTPDSNYGDGTESAIRAFQERNGLTRDGIAGRETLEKIFSTSAKKALKPYVLKVSVDKQRVYAYAPDKNEEYTILARTMTCSTGLTSSPTPRGTFQSSTGPGARWHYFKKFYCWAQYAYYIQGDIMFHSVLYGSKGGSVTSSSVRNLGSRASHGCVRLSVEDAKWIYEHCPQNTKVIVY